MLLVNQTTGREIPEWFLVDSGADLSMAPRRLCDALGLIWEEGELIKLQEISPRPECSVPGRIHSVDVVVREVDCQLRMPICFTECESASLLGREGFFDAFVVAYDKPGRMTKFEFTLWT